MDPQLSKAIVDFFLGIPLFQKMNAEEIKAVAKHMSVVDLKAGEILFREGDEGRFMCFIVNGELDVIKQPGASRKEVLINTLGRGKSIGEMSVIESLPRSATAKARVETRLFILSRPAFELVLSRHSNIGIKLLKGIATLLSDNLRKTSCRLAEYMLPIS
jgi:CRP-like cAMP-binding protein